MKKNDVRKIVQNCIISQNQLQIKRAKIDDDPIDAIPVNISKQMLLFKYIYDFEFDGFKVIRMKDVSSVRTGEIEKFHDKIFKKENINALMNIPNDIPIINWKIFFNSIYNKIDIVEIECEESCSKSFYIGKIISTDKEFLKIIEIDPLGHWHKQNSIINYKDITLVSLRTRYSMILSKYQTI